LRNNDGEIYGWGKEVNLLNFVKIKDAGHYTSMDQPKNMLYLINQFVDE